MNNLALITAMWKGQVMVEVGIFILGRFLSLLDLVLLFHGSTSPAMFFDFLTLHVRQARFAISESTGLNDYAQLHGGAPPSEDDVAGETLKR